MSIERKQNLIVLRRSESPVSNPLASVKHKASTGSKLNVLPTNKSIIHDWCLVAQDASNEVEEDDLRSMSASTFAQKNLEDRVFSNFGKDSSFAQDLISSLRDKLDIIWPLFSMDEDQDASESLFCITSPTSDSGSSQGTTSHSTGSSESKRSTTSIEATPTASADIGKDEKPIENEDGPSKNRQPSIKRRRSGI